LALQEQNPGQFPDRVEEPLAYLVFEGELVDLLKQLIQVLEKHARLREITQWLEEIIEDSDIDVRNLVGVSFCEWLVSSGQDQLQQFWPFMGEALRQSCREFQSHFRVSEENQQLLRQR